MYDFNNFRIFSLVHIFYVSIYSFINLYIHIFSLRIEEYLVDLLYTYMKIHISVFS